MRILLAPAGLLLATPAAAQVETPEQALTRDAATWGAVAGLTDAEAQAQLRTQEATVVVTDALRAEFGERVAGIAVSHIPAFRIDVLLTGDAPVADREEAGVSIAFRTGAVANHARLLAALREHQAAIRAILRRPPGIGIDERLGALAVLVADSDAARFAPDQLEQQLADLTGVPVVVRRLDQADANAAASWAAEGGGRMVGYEADGHRYACTSGFVVTDGARSGLVTAAHCPDTLSYVAPDRSETTLPYVGQWGWSFQDVQLHLSLTPLPPLFFADTAKTTERSPAAVRPRAQLRVGDVVCHRGERTGYSCAEVQYTDFAPAGDLCGGPCAPSWVAVAGPTCRGGDSGGPVFVGAVALGLVKGASYRPDGSCALWYYMSVDFLPDGWRVALVAQTPARITSSP